MAQGLAEVQSFGVIHRDLKPDNVIIKDGVAKLANFSLSTFENDYQKGLTESLGTLGYMAPEYYLGADQTSGIDVWSLGAMLFEALAGRPCFPPSLRNFRKALLYGHPKKPNIIPDLAWDLICKMIAKDPSNRATIEE
eukprot:Platyproteum_vivax@DN12358_c0_g1_i1.p1